MAKEPTNAQIADMLEQIADLLETQSDNPFRVRAYREGADSIRDHDKPVADDWQNQMDELKAVPHIGEGIAAVIGEYVSSGKSELLDELEAKVAPGYAFAKVPGIGEELAGRISDELHIHTLPELELTAHDGRLGTIEGFGPRRVEAVQTALAGMLSHSAQSQQRNRTAASRKSSGKTEERPSVEMLLDVDADYRKQSEADKLQKIAPKRFNPKNEAWLPVLHAKHSGWKFTALFSNTAQAHKLDKTDDWVVIYYEKDGKERQNTVVTETQGALKGKRVVRGREAENRAFYGAEANKS